MLPTSTNTPSPALANVFGHQFATQLVASRGSGSPSSSPSRAKKARPTPADPTTNPNNRPLPDESHGPTQPKCTEPKVLFKTGAGDEDYQAAIVADEEAGAKAGSRCFRCKRGMDMCGGVGVCVLGSNTFTATKGLKCHGCGNYTKVGIDLVTKMLVGKHRGFYLHLHCALTWHKVNPAAMNGTMPDLVFKTPPQKVMKFAQAFANRETPLARLQMTAGGGKTNMLVYLVYLLRNAGVTFIILVYNVAAKDELLSRGLLPHEVHNFHSFAYRALTSVLAATLTEDRVMANESVSSRNTIKATVCDIKIRLVAQLYFSQQPPEGPLLTKLFKTFIQDLCNLARTHALGCEGKPSCLDLPVLEGLAIKFTLAKKIEGAWNGVLTQPQKLTLNRIFGGDAAEARLKYGIAATAQVLELSYLVGTSREVMGCKFLFNETTHKKIPLPIIDSIDMVYLAARLKLAFLPKGAVLVDEAHDLDDIQIMLLRSMQKDNSHMLTVDDPGQSIYFWRGVRPEAYTELMRGAEHITIMDNHRNARSIVAVAQDVYNEMPVNMVIEARNDLEGVVASDATFFTYPLDLNNSIMILGRTFEHVLQLYMVLIGKGLPVQMHGQGNTAGQLEELLAEFTGGTSTLLHVRAKLVSYASINAPCADSVEYDMHMGLLELLKIFLARNPSADPTLPEVTILFSDFLHTFFTSDNKAGAGVIMMGTIHWSKGLEATDVYIVQPGTLPLAERVALGGWQKYEELCIQFVAYTRARVRLIMLTHLENFDRQNILALWDEPYCRSEPPTQETVAAESEDDEEDLAAAIDAALLLFGMQALPKTEAEINNAFKVAMRHAHPDRNFGTRAATEHAQRLLEARIVLKKAMLKGVGP